MLPQHSHHAPITFRHYISSIPLGLLILFIFVGLLSTPLFKPFLSFGNVEDALSGIKAENIVEMLGWQNAYFDNTLPKDYPKISFTKLAFTTATHISFTDERSLLGNELPGFSLFDTKIIVAGEGTNYTNVPIESAPPLEYILKDEKKEAKDGKDTPKTPPADVANAKVFIYSTHSWESYLPLVGKAGASNADLATAYDEKENIHVVDDLLQQALDNRGVNTVVSDSNITDILHEKDWGTNKAYSASRPIVQAAIASKKDYRLFIDIHRDSRRKKDTTKVINGESYARVAFVIGEGNPNSDKNEVLVKKLNQALSDKYPGISRGIVQKSQSEGNGIYNQDLSPHVILIEVGGVDNNLDELKRTVNALSDIISEYIKNADAV